MKLKSLSRDFERRVMNRCVSLLPATKLVLLSCFGAVFLSPIAQGQVGFSASKLDGLIFGGNNYASKATSIQFGPDDRLYFTQVNGTVVSCDVTRMGPDNYVASNVEIIDLVKNLPNYDDDGARNFSLNSRQATGILVVGTAENPIVYVTSSDPREGAGSGGADLNLDTNSGIISRLTRNGSGVWEKVDIVRGLPRSEENHASNGIQIDATGTTLYLAQGGNTNAGSPSNNFAFACETALSAAILSIDLAAINSMPVKTDSYGQQYIYDLPTLDDPNAARAENLDGSDVNDPFGGNDGLNQAKLVLGGPVQIYSSGFRNPYDVLIAKTPGKVGNMYTFDNAANSGWGGYPMNEDVPATVTNEYVPGEPGSVNNKDSLHLISGLGYYGGHPNPIRANPAGAGWFRNDDGPGGGGLVYSSSPTSDWPPVPVSMADPQQGDFRLPGAANGSLIVNSASTTGIAEYTANNFGGAMVGDIIATQYSNATVQRLTMNADGTQVLASSVLLQGSNYSVPLDVTAPGPEGGAALAGTIFVAHHSSKGITILEPTDFDSGSGTVCTGTFSFGLDEDNDGYSNADEISNYSDPCSPAVLPPDRDGDFLSDLLDTDDDNDGIADSQDVFPIDPNNGSDVASPMRYDLFNELGIGFFSIGFTGVMSNPGEDYSQRIDETELIAGGTAGLFTDPTVGPGSPLGSSNTQVNAFQFGVNVDEFTGPFRVISGLGGLLFNGEPSDAQSHGIFIGNGDQDNYVKVAVNANSGPGAIEVVHEEDGTVLSQNLYSEPGLFSGVVTLTFLVDPIAGTVQPGFWVGTGSIVDVGPPISVGGKVLDVIRGPQCMAVGLLATTGNVATPSFNATWDYFEVQPVATTAGAKLTINSGAGSITTSSVNTSGAFQVENTSTGGQKVTSIKIDLRTAILPDLIFDPAGTGGDTDGKAFELNFFDGNGTPVGSFEAPHDGIGSEDGFDVMSIDFDPSVEFRPGDLLTFSCDVDPTSVKGAPGPGPQHSASISGLELIGATITIGFDDGTVRKIRNAGITGTTNTNKSSVGIISSDNLPTPHLFVPGKTSPFVTATHPTVRLNGPAGSDAKIWVFNTALYLDGVADGGYDIDPFEANSIIGYGITDVTIPASGFIDVPVTLSDADPTSGINYIAAVLVDSGGQRSASSDILVVDYDPTGSGSSAIVRVNAGGGSYVDALGQPWSADNWFTSGSTSTYANPIVGTTEDGLYQTFRYDDSPSSPLDYAFVVPNGLYQVKLHFAETWSGITAAGQRTFDVYLEDQLKLDDLDVFAEAGPNSALVKTLETTVSDGELTIGFRHEVQNPFISAIEVFSLGIAGPDTEAPSSPSLLTSNNVTAGSVTLVWAGSSDNVGVSGYRVSRDGVEVGTTTQLSFVDSGRNPSTSYEYSVVAYDAVGNDSDPALIEVTTPADQEDPTTPGSIKGIAGNGLAILSWEASTDDAGVTGYRIYRDGLLISTVTDLTYTDSGLTNGTPYEYEVIAFDASGKVSTAATVVVQPRALGPAVLRVNVGGLEYLDLLGNTWVADHGYNTGVAETSSDAIANTDDDPIYQSRRFDRSHGAELKYSFPLPDGEYELRLHFAEVWTGATAPGIRVFDVKVEDQLALDDFDIFAEAGFATAVSIPIPVTVSGGQLTIEFLHVIQNPTLAGIEVYALEGPPPDTELPSQPGDLTVTGTSPGSVSLSWLESSDNIGVAGYLVKRGGVPLATVTSLEFTDTGLGADTVYGYTVAAVDEAGNLSVPATINAATDPDITPPGVPGSLTGIPGNGVAVLSWTPSADDSLVTGYKIWRGAQLLDTVTTLGYTDTGLENGTQYVYEVRAVDSGGNQSLPATTTVTPRALGAAFLRVNVGSAGSYVDSLNQTWSADFGYNTGYSEATTNAIAGTAEPVIYQTRRIDRSSGAELKYQFTVPNGSYEVRLHFAEVWSGAFATGIRVFDVSLEGNLALDGLDVFAEAGANNAYIAAVPVTVADGALNIDFQRVIQNPNLSGIEIFPVLGGGASETVPPSVPGNLAVSSLTTSSVTLVWSPSTDNVGVMGYRVYRNTLLVETVYDTIYSDETLVSGAGYDFAVVAFDLAGNTSPAAQISVTALVPDTESPTNPTNLVATPGLSHVALAWDASSDNVGVVGYLLLRDGAEIATVTELGYTDTNLPSSTEFDYEVLALDAVGNTSSPAQVTTITLIDTVAPESPANLVADPGFVTVALSWNASTDNAGVTGYRIYRDNVLLQSVTGTTFDDSGLIPGGTYLYGVEAEDSAGNLSSRVEVLSSTLEDSELPTPPTQLVAVAGEQSAVLKWKAATDNVGVTGYEVRRDGALVGTVSATEFADSGLTDGVLYSYEVRAVDGAGNASSPALVSVTPRVLGDAVVRVNSGGLGFTDGSGNIWYDDYGFNIGSTSSTAVTISGTTDQVLYQSERYDGSPSGADLEYRFVVADGQYEVRLHFAETYVTGPGQRVFDVVAEGSVALDDLDIFARVGSNATLAVSFPVTVSDGELNISFHHGVQNPKICGVEVFTVASDGIAPSVPEDLSGTSTQTEVRLSWTASTDNVGVTGYRILRDGSELGTVAALEFDDSGLSSNTSYEYQVIAVDAAGNSSAAATISLVTKPTFEEWLADNGLAGQISQDSDRGGLDNLAEFELQMNPNDPNDDLGFSIHCLGTPSGTLIEFPDLKPLGSYYLHRSESLLDIGALGSRIHSISRSEIEAMTPGERAGYSFEDNPGGARGFYRLYFEPSAE
ncbi:malectin domain-containing carbohydrate-binding protein [Luteolibacter marinus]|uniref:malectin domain-containing carbohydrate-binding protein n=1 Tax=Luteolibacter marinus TaxID=2776705 RepID=UPI0018672918|nr:malectin domain-containing carbohydrate-binding protein [Luteolibacter marinus]